METKEKKKKKVQEQIGLQEFHRISHYTSTTGTVRLSSLSKISKKVRKGVKPIPKAFTPPKSGTESKMCNT